MSIKQVFKCQEVYTMEKTWKMDVDCANCALMMEEAVRKVKGVESVTINAMTQKISLRFEENINMDDMMKQIVKVCRRIEPDSKICM